MRKLLFIVILLGIVALGFYAYMNSRPTENSQAPTSDSSPSPANATFVFDEGTITLSAGKSIQKEDGIVDEVTLLEERSSGDLNNDGKPDSAVLLARSGGGSGVFVYVAAFVSGPVSYKGTKAIYLGDRVSPQLIDIEGGVVTVRYLDREDDEALAAEPTVPVTKEFVYKNGEFVER